MAGTALLGRLTWQLAELVEVVAETPRVKTIVFDVPRLARPPRRDKIELRGPIGGYFVWEPSEGGPLMLVAGGSGIVPLMAMIRTRAAAGDDTQTRLLYSSRSQDDVIYRDELERLSGNGLTVVHALTDSQPPGWTSYARRVDAEMLAEVSPSPAERPRFYACGPTPFVEAVAESLVRLGHDTRAIKTERFGPTGR
jgi:ferredoxin-NADP reductase